jgi:orotate phosphoribosyltransferase
VVDAAAATVTNDLLHQLFDHALLRGSFTLRSGATSDRYFDKYQVATNPELLRSVTRAFAAHLDQLDEPVTCIVTPALGGVPLATALSLHTGLPFVIVRDGGKSYGTKRDLEGSIQVGARAVLIEDVVTSGGAAVAAHGAATDAGLRIVASMCILDRGRGGSDALAAIGAPLYAIARAADLDAAFDAGLGQTTDGS